MGSTQVALNTYEHQPLDEDTIQRYSFDLLMAFDEVISFGHKEHVTLQQVKTYTEMDSHEEKLHKMIIQSKINDTKDVMKKKASEIDKSKVPTRLGPTAQSLATRGAYRGPLAPWTADLLSTAQVEKMREGGGGGGKSFAGLGSISSTGGLGGFMSELEGEVSLCTVNASRLKRHRVKVDELAGVAVA